MAGCKNWSQVPEVWEGKKIWHWRDVKSLTVGHKKEKTISIVGAKSLLSDKFVWPWTCVKSLTVGHKKWKKKHWKQELEV